MSKQLLCKCITLFSTFLWRPLHDYDVKPPNATFYGGRGHTKTNFPFSIWTWIKPLRIQLKDKSPAFDEFTAVPNWCDKVWKQAIFFLVMFSLPSLSSSLLKVPNLHHTPLSELSTIYASAANESWKVFSTAVHASAALITYQLPVKCNM